MVTPFRSYKTLGPPSTYVPDAVYYERVGVGFDLRVTDAAGVPYLVNSPLLSTLVIAGEAIGGHRAVVINPDDRVWLADPATAGASPPVGISVSAASAGTPIPIRTSGLTTETSWNWVSGPIYLGAGGTLTQTVPTMGAIVSMGVAAGPDRMRVDPKLIAILT